MPIYSFKCADLHVTDHLVKSGPKPETVDCACGLPAWPTVALTAPIVVAGRSGPREGAHAEGTPPGVVYESDTLRVRVHGATHDIRCAELKCTVCAHDYFDALAAADPLPPCPKCGAPAEEKIGFPDDSEAKRYPYYDRGLGLILTSPAHRREVCKAKGLVPVDGDWDADAMLREIHEQTDRHDAAYADYADRLDNDPSFASYRHARDRGDMPRAR